MRKRPSFRRFSPVCPAMVRKFYRLRRKIMSPEAIQSLIEMFGVEKGVQVLNLFTVQPEQVEHPLPA